MDILIYQRYNNIKGLIHIASPAKVNATFPKAIALDGTYPFASILRLGIIATIRSIDYHPNMIGYLR